MTDPQIRYTVDFWSGRLKPKVSDDFLLRFEKSLKKVLQDDRDIRAACCHFGPQSTLQEALENIGLLREPPVLTDDVDLIANHDGTIDLRVDNHWQRVKPEE